jgi:hypothetical protein
MSGSPSNGEGTTSGSRTSIPTANWAVDSALNHSGTIWVAAIGSSSSDCAALTLKTGIAINATSAIKRSAAAMRAGPNKPAVSPVRKSASSATSAECGLRFENRSPSRPRISWALVMRGESVPLDRGSLRLNGQMCSEEVRRGIDFCAISRRRVASDSYPTYSSATNQTNHVRNGCLSSGQ